MDNAEPAETQKSFRDRSRVHLFFLSCAECCSLIYSFLWVPDESATVGPITAVSSALVRRGALSMIVRFNCFRLFCFKKQAPKNLYQLRGNWFFPTSCYLCVQCSAIINGDLDMYHTREQVGTIRPSNTEQAKFLNGLIV